MLMNQSKATIRLVTQATTGHAGLYRHLHLMNLADSPMCRNCGLEEETTAHILDVCPSFATTRATVKRTWGEAMGAEGEVWTIPELADFLRVPAVERLFHPP